MANGVGATLTDDTPVSDVQWRTDSDWVFTRLNHAFADMGIGTVGDLRKCNEFKLSSQPYIGRKSINAVVETLRENGMALAANRLPPLPPDPVISAEVSELRCIRKALERIADVLEDYLPNIGVGDG
jgi:hypothetical protein